MFKLSRLWPFGILTLFTSFSAAIISTIWAVYIETFVHSEATVGFITAGLTIVQLIAYIVLIPYLEQQDKLGLYFGSLFTFGILYVIYALNKNFYVFLLLAIVNTFLWVSRSVTYGELLRNMCSIKDIGKAESFTYSLSNISYLAGPIVAGFVADKFGINLVFLLAAFFVLVAAVGFRIIKVRKVPLPRQTHRNLLKNIITFFKNKKIVNAYIIGSGIDFWWGLVYTFVPLFIMEQGGLDITWVGYFFAAVTIPLIFLEYYFGRVGDRKGFRVLFLFGHLGLAAAAALCFLFTNIFIVMGILIVASIFAAMIEPSAEAYFFKFIPRDNEDQYYSIFHTCIPISGFIARVAGAVVLLLFPWNYVFLTFAVIMGLFTIYSIRAKE